MVVLGGLLQNPAMLRHAKAVGVMVGVSASEHPNAGTRTAPRVTVGVRPDLGSATSVLEFWLRKNSGPRLKP